MQDGSVLSSWPYLRRETPQQRLDRHASIQAACKEGDRINALNSQMREDIQLAKTLKGLEPAVIEGQMRAFRSFEEIMKQKAAAKAYAHNIFNSTLTSAALGSTEIPPIPETKNAGTSLNPVSPLPRSPVPSGSPKPVAPSLAPATPRPHTDPRPIQLNPRHPSSCPRPPRQSRLNFDSPGKGANKRQTGTEAATTAGSAEQQVHSTLFNSNQLNSHNSARWKLHRVRAVAEVADENVPLFQHVAGSLFAAYKTHSEASLYDNCQRIAHMILDLPAQTLSEGSVREQKKWLEKTDAHMADLIKTLNKTTQEEPRDENNNHNNASVNQHSHNTPNDLVATKNSCVVPMEIDEQEPTTGPHEHTHSRVNMNETHVDPSVIPNLSTSPLANTTESDIKAPSAPTTTSPPSSRPSDPHSLPLPDPQLTECVQRAVRIIRAGGPRCLSRAAQKTDGTTTGS